MSCIFKNSFLVGLSLRRFLIFKTICSFSLGALGFLLSLSAVGQNALELGSLSGALTSMQIADSKSHEVLAGSNNNIQPSMLRGAYYHYGFLLDEHMTIEESGEVTILFRAPVQPNSLSPSDVLKVMDKVVLDYLMTQSTLGGGQVAKVYLSDLVDVNGMELITDLVFIEVGHNSGNAVKKEKNKYNSTKNSMDQKFQSLLTGNHSAGATYGFEIRLDLNQFKDPAQVAFDLEFAFEELASKYLDARFSNYPLSVNRSLQEKFLNTSIVGPIYVNALIQALATHKGLVRVDDSTTLSYGVDQSLEQLLDLDMRLDHLEKFSKGHLLTDVIVRYSVDGLNAKNVLDEVIRINLAEYFNYRIQYIPQKSGYFFSFLHFAMLKIAESGKLLGPLRIDSAVIQSSDRIVHDEIDRELFNLRARIVKGSVSQRNANFVNTKAAYDGLKYFVRDFTGHQPGNLVSEAVRPAINFLSAIVPPTSSFGTKMNPAVKVMLDYMSLPNYLTPAAEFDPSQNQSFFAKDLEKRDRTGLAKGFQPGQLYLVGSNIKSGGARHHITGPTRALGSGAMPLIFPGMGANVSRSGINNLSSGQFSNTNQMGQNHPSPLEEQKGLSENSIQVKSKNNSIFGGSNWGQKLSEDLIGKSPADIEAANAPVSEFESGSPKKYAFWEAFNHKFRVAIERKQDEATDPNLRCAKLLGL